MWLLRAIIADISIATFDRSHNLYSTVLPGGSDLLIMQCVGAEISVTDADVHDWDSHFNCYFVNGQSKLVVCEPIQQIALKWFICVMCNSAVLCISFCGSLIIYLAFGIVTLFIYICLTMGIICILNKAVILHISKCKFFVGSSKI